MNQELVQNATQVFTSKFPEGRIEVLNRSAGRKLFSIIYLDKIEKLRIVMEKTVTDEGSINKWSVLYCEKDNDTNYEQDYTQMLKDINKFANKWAEKLKVKK